MARFYNVSGYPVGINRSYLDLLSNNLKTTTDFLNLFKSGLKVPDKELYEHIYSIFDTLSIRFNIYNNLVMLGELNDAQFLLLSAFNTHMM